MPIGRLFFEISGDSSKLNASLREAIATAKDAGVQITRAGQSFISKFDEALNPTKKLTEQIQLLEATGKKQSDIMKVMGGQIESATKAAKEMGAPIDDLVRKYTSLESRLKTTGQGLQEFGRGASMYLTVPLMGFGAAAIKAADDYDKGIANIRAGTGATGEKLKTLTEDMNALWGKVPNSVENIGTAIADLNMRLGLAGKPLQEMAEQILNLSRLSGGDLKQTIADATRVFGDWSVSSGKQAETLDYLFRMSQNTGIGIQRLMETVVQFGAPMRALGFNLESASAAIAKWEKEGVNMETVLAGLKMGLGQMAKAGADPIQVLHDVQVAIKNAKNDTEALSIGLKVFGQRAAVDMTKAIQEGRFNLEELIDATRRGTDSINKADESTKTFGEHMEELQQKTEKALVPIGEKLLEVFIKLQPTIEDLIGKLAGAAEWFANLDPLTQKLIIGVAGFAAALGPASYAIGSIVKMVSSLSGALSGAGGLVGVLGKLGPAAAVAGSAFAGWQLGRLISETFDLDEKLGKLWRTMGLFEGRVRESNDILEKTTIRAYTALLEKHSDDLARLNIDISRGNKSLSEWADTVNQAGAAVMKLHPHAQKLADAAKEAGKQAGNAGLGLSSMDEELQKLKERFEKAIHPADELAGEMRKLTAAGIPIKEVLAVYGDELVVAAEKQDKLGQKLKATTEKLYDQAAAIKLAQMSEKARQEGPQLLQSAYDANFAEMQKRWKQQEKDQETYASVRETIDRQIAEAGRDQLELQEKILDLGIPRNQREKEFWEMQKAGIDYQIKAGEIAVRFETQRLELYKKLEGMDVMNGEAYQKALDAIDELNALESQALQNLADQRNVEILAKHRDEYLKMVDGVKSAAGEVFDAILSGGKNAFENLMNWLKATFLTGLRQIFQNAMAALYTGNFSLQNIFGGMAIGFGGPSPAPGQFGNALGTLAGNSGEIGIMASLAGGAELPGPGQKIGSMGSIIPSGTGANFGGLTGSYGNLAATGAMTIGMPLMVSGFTGEGAGSWAKAIGGGALTGAGIGSFIPGIGTAVGALVGGGAGLIGKGVGSLVNVFTGKSNEEAGVDEIARDYGGVVISQDQYTQLTQSWGFPEGSGELWNARGDVAASPQMLQNLYQLAQQQGKTDELMQALQKNWGGTTRFDIGMEIGRLTGDWSKLNEQWKESVYYQDLVKRGLKEQADAMMIGDQALKPWEQAVKSLGELRKSLQDSIQPVKSVFEKFVDTGVVTKELREELDKLGISVDPFQNFSGLVKLNDYCQKLVEHFRQTGEILPDLRKMIEDYGGSLEALDEAAALPGLKQTLASISDLKSGLQGLLTQFDPIRKLLEGDFSAQTQAGLAARGFDPAQFESLANLIKAEQNWQDLSQKALQGGTVSPEMLSVLSQYGGDAGALAVERYNEGFNTITSGLLDQTKANMDMAYQGKIQDALAYLGEMEQTTNSNIEALTGAVEEQITAANDGITAAMNEAKAALVDALDQVIMALVDAQSLPDPAQVENNEIVNAILDLVKIIADKVTGTKEPTITTETGATPTIIEGGTGTTVAETGSAAGQVVYITLGGNVYGWDDFVEQVRQAGITLDQRGTPLTQPGT